MNDKNNEKTLEHIPEVGAFIDAACSKVRSKELKNQIEAEILSHLDSHIQERSGSGVSFSEAVALALASLGDPKDLRHGLFEANLPFYARKRFYMPLVGSVLATAMFIGAVEYYSYRAKSLLDNRIAKVSGSLTQFLHDDEELKEVSLFENRVKGKDFGTVINHKIPWHGSDIKVTSPIAIPKDISEKITYLGENWIKERNQIDLNSIDLSWMDQLHSYDIWDLYKSGPASAYDRNVTAPNPFDVPMPQYERLAGFAKLALIKGIADNNLSTAISNVEHLARLTYSNETMMGGIIAISMLKSNLVAYEFGLERKILELGSRPAYTSVQLEKARRILFARANYFDFTNSKRTLVTAFPMNSDISFSVGYCHALDEAIKAMTVYHKFFDGNFPYESNHQRNIDYISNVIRASKNVCRISPARHVWVNRDRIPNLSGALSMSFDPLKTMILRIAAHIPYVRKSVGAMLIAMARPHFSGY